MFDLGQNLIVGAGPQFPYLVVKRMDDAIDFNLYKLPNEARGIE